MGRAEKCAALDGLRREDMGWLQQTRKIARKGRKWPKAIGFAKRVERCSRAVISGGCGSPESFHEARLDPR
jgi:hypothetical protein